MKALSYYDDISFEEKIDANCLHLIVTVSDKKAKTSRVAFERAIPLLWFIPLFIILSVPFIILLFTIMLVTYFRLLFESKHVELSYEETKKYFESGRGYLNNLSAVDKKKLLVKEENTPFGL